MKQDSGPDSWFTTMIDLYKLPADFPGVSDYCRERDPIKRVRLLEGILASDLDNARFIPYIQVHEFEALLFSDPEGFSIAFPANAKDVSTLKTIRKSFETPEHIDDGECSAPSKRIVSLLPDYDKVSAGPLVAKQIGLPRLRAECLHFDDWLERLERAGKTS